MPGLWLPWKTVPRHKFIPGEIYKRAYDNGPVGIGSGQTISQPYIVALMSDLLNTKPTDSILEFGTGSGYQAAILSQMVEQVYRGFFHRTRDKIYLSDTK